MRDPTSRAQDYRSILAAGGGNDSNDDSGEEVRGLSEPKILDTIKAFDLKAYVRDSVGYYRARPAALRSEILSGVTLALIEVPESVAFAFMAGVDPIFGMAAVFWIGCITGIFGGRPAMISGAAGAMAVVLGDLTKDNGPLGSYSRPERVEQLMMVVFLTGVLEVLAGPLIAAFVQVIPQPAMIGFMDALAIIITKAQAEAFQVCTKADTLFNQCPEEDKAWLRVDEGRTWCFLAHFCLTLVLMLLLPKMGRVGRLVPASLVAIVVGTALEWGIFRALLHTSTRTVAETAYLANGLPGFHWPALPVSPSWGTIWAYSASLATIGLIESVMTHEVVNSLVKDPPDALASIQECFVQGVANILCGLFGALGGSALIGESVINVLHGAKGRVSSFMAGLTMLAVVEGLSDGVGLMPVATLAGVIVTVALHTMQWHNLTQLHILPPHDTVIILVVCVLSVLTNLAIGVVVGVGLSSLWHVWTSGRQLKAKATTSTDAQGNAIKVYNLRGSPLFFGSSRPLLRLFAYESDPEVVVVDVTDVDLSDLSGITALNEVGKRYQEHGCKRVIVRGLDAQGLQLVRRCKGQATHLHIDGMQDELPIIEPHATPLGVESVNVEGGLEVGLEMGVAEGPRDTPSALQNA